MRGEIMRPLRFFLFILVVTCAGSTPGQAQANTAVPFLLFSPSAEANGMAGTTIALTRSDPTASIFSPAQIGISALIPHLNAAFYTSGAKIPSAIVDPGVSYAAWAAGGGVRLNDFVDLPVELGLGLAYHDVELDLGSFNRRDPANNDLGTFDAYETARGIVLGIGIEYVLRFGFGYTFRSIDSHLAPFGTETPSSQEGGVTSTVDYSFLLEAPLARILQEITGSTFVIGEAVQPFANLSVGLGWNNIGDQMVYIDPNQADPLPRTARAGLAVSGGVHFGHAAAWELASAAWSREADDLLVIREQDGSWQYQSGLGDIHFGTHVVRGASDGEVSLRSGWQVRIAELFTYRAGTVTTSMAYDTRGYTFQLAGVLKGIGELLGNGMPDWVAYVRDHVDIQYHSAQYEDRSGGTVWTSYSGVTLSFHEWQW